MPARYDTIGAGYDTTRRADPYITSRILSHLSPREGGNYIDIACGTGNYTIALARLGHQFVGVDQSMRMLSCARQKSSGVSWQIADVERLPFTDAAFDGAICTLAIHHFPNLSNAVAEIRRVLRRGRLVVFTATHDQMRGCWLNAYFPRAMAASTEMMPDLPELKSALIHNGLCNITTEPYTVHEDLEDLFLYSGKHRPAMYLDPKVRAGISTFAMQTDPAEIDTGCRQLAHDIESGRIDAVRQRYEHELGDYIFVIAEVPAGSG